MNTKDKYWTVPVIRISRGTAHGVPGLDVNDAIRRVGEYLAIHEWDEGIWEFDSESDEAVKKEK